MLEIEDSSSSFFERKSSSSASDSRSFSSAAATFDSEFSNSNRAESNCFCNSSLSPKDDSYSATLLLASSRSDSNIDFASVTAEISDSNDLISSFNSSILDSALLCASWAEFNSASKFARADSNSERDSSRSVLSCSCSITEDAFISWSCSRSSAISELRSFDNDESSFSKFDIFSVATCKFDSASLLASTAAFNSLSNFSWEDSNSALTSSSCCFAISNSPSLAASAMEDFISSSIFERTSSSSDSSATTRALADSNLSLAS